VCVCECRQTKISISYISRDLINNGKRSAEPVPLGIQCFIKLVFRSHSTLSVNKWEKVSQIFSSKLKSNALLY